MKVLAIRKLEIVVRIPNNIDWKPIMRGMEGKWQWIDQPGWLRTYSMTWFNPASRRHPVHTLLITAALSANHYSFRLLTQIAIDTDSTYIGLTQSTKANIGDLWQHLYWIKTVYWRYGLPSIKQCYWYSVVARYCCLASTLKHASKAHWQNMDLLSVVVIPVLKDESALCLCLSEDILVFASV